MGEAGMCWGREAVDARTVLVLSPGAQSAAWPWAEALLCHGRVLAPPRAPGLRDALAGMLRWQGQVSVPAGSHRRLSLPQPRELDLSTAWLQL